MAGGASDDQDEEITGINVTPLVDVMLVLLIIFMVTANYINNQAIEVNLPSADTGEVVEENSELNLTITASGQFGLNGEIMNFSDLIAKVAEIKQDSQTVSALIGADEQARHGIVMQLINGLRKLGINDMAFSTEQPDQGSGSE